MPKWTYSITIINGTDRPLELVSSNIPWGEAVKKFPKSIAAGAYGEFSVFSPAAVPSGIEFYFSMRDKPSASGEPGYGTFSFSVDIPYWSHANKSNLNCTGVLVQNGFEKIPDGAHDFSTTVTISTTLCALRVTSNVESSEYCNLYDWDTVQKLETIDPSEKTIDDFIPESNIFTNRKTVSRTEKISVPKEMWNQIIDEKFPDSYSKKNFVKEYFTVSAYEIRKNVSIPIAADQSYEKTLEISNRSTVRRETRTEFQIENTINADVHSETATLSETLRMQYQISKLNEYCREDMKSVREVFYYNPIEYDRDVVLWDLVEILSLYHVRKDGRIELVGVGDYYMTATQKTYIRGNESNAEENDEALLLCANSNAIYHIESEDLYADDEPKTPLKALSGTITINSINYRWMEKSFGTNRGMEFNPGKHTYKFTPNPHDDPKYNKNQSGWYAEMAHQIKSKGDSKKWTRDNWDDNISGLRVNNITYTATVR